MTPPSAPSALPARTRRRVAAALAVALAALVPPTLHAQVRTCTLVQGGTLNQFTSAGLGVVQQFGGPVTFRCAGDVLIQSRRATVLESRREVRLEGDVLYRDSVQELRTDYLQRRTGDGFMLARGSVVMRDLASGSEIRGSQMERRDRAGIATETRISGRPHATLYREEADEGPAGALGAPAPDGVPIDVDADSIILVGSNIFRAVGSVEFRRGMDLRGSGRALEFDDASGRLRIDGDARVDGARYDLSGDRVDALTVEGVIREVSAFGDAVLEGEAMYLEAPEVYLFFERELLQRLEARSRPPRVSAPAPPPDTAELAADAPGRAAGRRAGEVEGVRPRPEPPPELRVGPGRAARQTPAPAAAPGEEVPDPRAGDGGADGPRVFARAEGLEVRADSLYVLSPDERLETLTAVGVAHGVRLADSLAAAALPEGYADEWVMGDTVVARFAADTAAAAGAAGEGPPDAVAAADSAERVLERLEAVGHGTPASAFSHVVGDTPGDFTLNYLIARRIVMLVSAGQAREVQAEGTLRGVYLTPDGTPRAQPAVEEGDPAAGTGEGPPVEGRAPEAAAEGRGRPSLAARPEGAPW
ncbi:MAG TPA: hypothetical protein VML95_01895 [Longimicrobiales bacterium]|nr:hypothetical protein [Longimicrobiales bacterium]